MNNAMNNNTNFGFKEVPKEEKERLVHGVFSSVADKYDIMNDVMSLGIHRMWKNRMIEMLQPYNGAKLIDMAGGTGDIAFRFIKKAQTAGKKVQVTIADINEKMLEEGRARAIDRSIIDGVEWKLANAEKLPFPDNEFDYYTIAFGIRNVTDISAALKEAYRVLKPGGKFVCLEFSQVDNKILGKIYDSYSFNIIPFIGNIVTGDKDSYQYLVESIRRFPTREEFSKMMGKAGFNRMNYETISLGVVAIHYGWKI